MNLRLVFFSSGVGSLKPMYSVCYTRNIVAVVHRFTACVSGTDDWMSAGRTQDFILGY